MPLSAVNALRELPEMVESESWRSPLNLRPPPQALLLTPLVRVLSEIVEPLISPVPPTMKAPPPLWIAVLPVMSVLVISMVDVPLPSR
jgi:hypothetical protein